MSAGTRTTYTLPVDGKPVAVDHRGRKIAVESVEWAAYLHEGGAYRIVTAYSANHLNTSWRGEDSEIPEWVPRPPEAWFVLADAIAAQAVTP